MADLSAVVPGQLLGTALCATAELAAQVCSPLWPARGTNVSGPRVPLHFIGSRIVSMCGFGPISEGMGLIHLVGSCCDALSMSIAADDDMLLDVEFYVSSLRGTFEALQR